MSKGAGEANKRARDAWNRNADFWDAQMGEGNHFVEMLTWPAIERLLELQEGEQVLDVACGNGLTSRRLAALGTRVTAFDLSEKLIEHARRRTQENADRIDYRVLDATDEEALLSLGERQFDLALCHMALFDMAEVEPLMKSLTRLLRPGGRFLFAVLHPCFNQPLSTPLAELQDREGDLTTVHAIKVQGYLSSRTFQTVAMPDQPEPNPLFHRPLQELFRFSFEAGFVLDALEEPAFPPDYPAGTHPLLWGGNFSEIPPVLVARMRLLGS